MKLVSISMAGVALIAAGCNASGSNTGASKQSTPSAATTQRLPCIADPACPHPNSMITRENYWLVQNDPDSLEGAHVSIVGRVFSIKRLPAGVYFEMYVHPVNDKWETAVYASPDTKVSKGEYVLVSGTVAGNENGRHAVGTDISLPSIDAFVVGTAAMPGSTLAPSDPPLAFLVFYGGGEHGVPERGSIFVADLSGRGIRRLTSPEGFATDPAWSPGARRIAYSQGGRILVMDRNGRHRRLVVKADGRPRWSPDGKRLAYQGSKGDAIEIVDVATRKTRALHPNAGFIGPALDWYPDGRTIAFTASPPGSIGHNEIYAISVEGESVRKLASAPAGVDLDMPRWSPNGKRLLYTWHRNRTTFLYLANADGSNARRLIRTDAGARASWSWDGHRLVYGVVDIQLFNLRTGARRKIDLRLCRRYSCQDLDWSRTR